MIMPLPEKAMLGKMKRFEFCSWSGTDLKKIAQIWPTAQNAQKQTTQNKGTVMRHVLQCTRAATHTHTMHIRLYGPYKAAAHAPIRTGIQWNCTGIYTQCTYAYTHIWKLHRTLYGGRPYRKIARPYIRNAQSAIRARGFRPFFGRFRPFRKKYLAF